MIRFNKDPERVYGSILIFISVVVILFVLFIARNLNGYQQNSQTKFLIELGIIFTTGACLLFREKNYIIGRTPAIVLLILVAAAFTDMFIGAIAETGKKTFPLFLYFGLFFLMNLLILLRLVKSKR
jgi:CDP-diglyceride synthetase